MQIKREKVWIHILAIFAARANIEGMYPFTIAFLLAAYLADSSSIVLYGILLLGLVSKLALGAAIKYGIIMLATMLT